MGARLRRPASLPAGIETFEFRPDLEPAQLGVAKRPLDPRLIRQDFPILQERVHGRQLIWLDNAATTQKPQRGDRSPVVFLRARELQHPSRRPHARGARHRRLRERAREGAPLPERCLNARDRLRPRHHRGHQPRRARAGAAATSRRRRDRHHLAGAPRQHRALAAAVLGKGRAPARGAGRRSRPGHPRRVREAARPAHAARLVHPGIERARHDHARRAR